MEKIYKFPIGVFLGAVTHLIVSPIIDNWKMGGTGKLWRRGSRYIIGVLITFPLYVLMCDFGKDDDTEKLQTEAINSFLLSFISTGAGVAIGYWLDTEEGFTKVWEASRSNN